MVRSTSQILLRISDSQRIVWRQVEKNKLDVSKMMDTSATWVNYHPWKGEAHDVHGCWGRRN